LIAGEVGLCEVNLNTFSLFKLILKIGSHRLNNKLSFFEHTVAVDDFGLLGSITEEVLRFKNY